MENTKSTDLEGVLVVSIEQSAAAPYLSCKLADAGARVIKIERPEGDFSRDYDQMVHGESTYFVWLNRGKESICLDLENDTDKGVLSEMLAQADVFIQNLAPGAVERLGFCPKKLREKYPRLITCSISGYGADGPMANDKAYDLLIQGESGLASVTGNEWGSTRVGVSVGDIMAGSTAAQSVFQALYVRERTGVGRHIAVSLFHALTDWMNVPMLQYSHTGKSPERIGLHHPSIAPYGCYICANGQPLLIAIQNEREWEAFCFDVLKKRDLFDDPRFADPYSRVANREAMDAFLVPFFLGFSRQDMMQRLKSARIGYGRVNSIAEVLEHPQSVFCTVETQSGPVKMFAPGAVVDGQKLSFGAVPARGEQGEDLRREFSSV